MARIFISPSKYVQGPNELSRLADYTTPLGKHAFVIASDALMQLTRPAIEQSYAGGQVTFAQFSGECSKPEIERLKEVGTAAGIDVVVGVGGGKTIDTAKAVAYYLHLPVVVAPTVASTDAPCSALSVLYKENGEFDEYLFLPTNPAAVIMDTTVIVNAPTRLLVAGMGDALATYFEARASQRSGAKAMAGGLATDAAMALAELCYETLLAEGLKAKLAAERKVVTEAVEKVIEANTLLSGLGFESGGLAAAHAIHNGLTVLEEAHDAYHGEKVAFGVLAQLMLENAPLDEIEEFVDFCLSVDLPVCLADLGVKNPDPDKLRQVAELACAEGETIFNMPFEVTPEMVYAAILAADQLGQQYRNA